MAALLEETRQIIAIFTTVNKNSKGQSSLARVVVI